MSDQNTPAAEEDEEYITRQEAEALIDKQTDKLVRKIDELERALSRRERGR